MFAKFACLSFLFTFASLSAQPLVDPYDPFEPATDAFTMLGDSRTHWVSFYGNWHDHDYLGQHRTSCSAGKTTVHNAGSAGSTAQQWATCMLYGLHPLCRPENMHRRVVVMIGGNDVDQRKDEWRNIPWSPIREHVKNKVLNEIHEDVKRIVNTLLLSGKEVVVQGQFKVNPDKLVDWYDNRLYAGNEGLMGLRKRAHDEYHPRLEVVNPGYFWITGWTSVCGVIGWCPFCFQGCVPVPIVAWQPPEIVLKGFVPNVSYADIPTDFPAGFFLDDVHLNQAGYIYHSLWLNNELRNRCWW